MDWQHHLPSSSPSGRQDLFPDCRLGWMQGWDPASAGPHVLLWLEVPVDDPQAVQVVESQCQLCQVELHVLLSEHDLQAGGGSREVLGYNASSSPAPRQDFLHPCCFLLPFLSFPDFTHHL